MNLSLSQIIRHLPRRVTFADGHITEYLYAATGEKLQTKYLVDNRTVFAAMALGETESDEVMESSDSTAIETLLTRDYCGDYIYEDRELERISTANGYISPSGVYTFYISDYQGNIVNLAPSTRTSNWNEYYPFGVHHSLTSSDRYLYSGKELDKTNGLYLYDFHARHYDPMLACFTTIDPLCEKYYPISPYAYCAGNPIRYIDPTGMMWIMVSYGDHTFIYYDSTIDDVMEYNRAYSSRSNCTFLGGSGTLVFGNPADKSATAFALLEDGNVAQDGKLLDSEYDSENLHIGSDLFIEEETTDNNYYGHYLGHRNPKAKDKNKDDAYSVPPIDDLDFAAWEHDRAYDAVGASGPFDAILNTKTVSSDLRFTCQAFAEINFWSKKGLWALGATIAFSYITAVKTHPITRYPLQLIYK